MLGPITTFFAWLNDRAGLNFSVFTDSFDGSRFLTGLITTIELSVLCMVLSVMLGLLGVWLLDAGRMPRAIVRGYVQVFRNTPPLVQLAFFYFALGGLLPTITDSSGAASPLISGFGWAVVSFSLFAGAFNVEIFRSGIEAVPSAMIEAADSLGYSKLQLYRHVLFPLGLRICLPALTNNMVNLVKTTTLAYAIAVPELLYAAAQIWGEVMNVREMMDLLLVVYIVLIALLVWTMEAWERALRVPGYSP
jgi:polar amino acid transport system permease protein